MRKHYIRWWYTSDWKQEQSERVRARWDEKQLGLMIDPIYGDLWERFAPDTLQERIDRTLKEARAILWGPPCEGCSGKRHAHAKWCNHYGEVRLPFLHEAQRRFMESEEPWVTFDGGTR